jgi:hypothetical protein
MQVRKEPSGVGQEVSYLYKTTNNNNSYKDAEVVALPQATTVERDLRDGIRQVLSKS